MPAYIKHQPVAFVRTAPTRLSSTHGFPSSGTRPPVERQTLALVHAHGPGQVQRQLHALRRQAAACTARAAWRRLSTRKLWLRALFAHGQSHARLHTPALHREAYREALTRCDRPALPADGQHPPVGKAHDRQALAVVELFDDAAGAVDQPLPLADVLDQRHLRKSGWGWECGWMGGRRVGGVAGGWGEEAGWGRLLIEGDGPWSQRAAGRAASTRMVQLVGWVPAPAPPL